MTAASLTLRAEPVEDGYLLTFPSLSGIPGFAHAVTTRPWNMAPHQGPQAERAVERRRRVCDHLGLPFERLTAAEQIHSGHVLRVLPSDVGAGREGRDSAIRFIDGMICDLPAVPLIMFSADCPLILAVDPVRRVFGVAHASWRGTAAGIAAELVRQLRQEFAAIPEDLLVGIGPCAGPAAYEVGDEVFRIFSSRLADGGQFLRRRGDRYLLDLRAANAAQLVAAGVRPERVTIADHCTMTDPRFFSHRRDGAGTGRFAMIAGFR